MGMVLHQIALKKLSCEMNDFVKPVPKANIPKSSKTRHRNAFSNDYFNVVP